MTNTTPSTQTKLPAPHGRVADRLFRSATRLAGLLLLAVLAGVAAFLAYRSVPAFRADTANFLTTTDWLPDADPSRFGIAALAFGSLLSALLALVAAVPVALAVAVFITDYAPPRIASALGYMTDLLAAIPSVVYGLWGLYFLIPHLTGVQQFLATYFGWIPIFAVPANRANVAAGTMFIAALVLAVMILPIIAAVCRETFRQVPVDQREAVLALGGTRAEVIRAAVLPPSHGGIIAAMMLGLGRAVGETIALALVLGTSYAINWHVLSPGGNTIAANIALQFGEAGSVGLSALIASGLVLFAITLIVNLLARAVIYRTGHVERSVAV